MITRYFTFKHRSCLQQVMLFMRIILLFSFFVQGFTCSAQENKNKNGKWELRAAFVASRVNNIDNTFSTLVYSGTNIGGSLSVRYKKEKSYHEINAFYSGGTLETSAHATTLNNNYLNIGYSNLYIIGSAKHAFKFSGGGGIDILYAQRNYNDFVNNNYSFEFASSLSGIFEISYLFNSDPSGFLMTDRLNVPLISAVGQTAFGSDDASGNIRILSFSSFLRFKNCLSIEKNISSRQKLGLGYTWDFYHLDDLRDVKQASHELALIYCYIF